MKARFKGSIWRTGNAHVITVPAQYVKDGVVELEQEYTIEIHKANEVGSDDLPASGE